MQSSKEIKSENIESQQSHTWEDITLSDDDEENVPKSGQQNNKSETVENMVLNLARESARQILEATPDFIANITAVTMFCLLAYFVLNKTGMTMDDLRPFLHLSFLWLASITGGYIIRLFRLPSLLGMILASVLIRNTGNIIIPDSWGEIITSSGLAIILLISGLKLDLTGVHSGTVVRLTFIPGIVEAICSGIFSILIFGMPFWLGLSLGFILAAVSPALVVVGMLRLQDQGYGVRKGIPSLIIAAASFDDIVAITGFSFFIGLAIQSKHTSVLYSVLHGPLSIIIGVGIGIASGVLLSITKLWNKGWKRSTVAVLLVLCIMFSMKQLSYAGAGAMGSLITGIMISRNWEAGVPRSLSKEPSKGYIRDTVSHLSLLWSLVFEPLLFGFIGSSLDFDLLQGSLTKSFGIVVIGVTFRLAAAYISTGGDSELTGKERAFIALSWIPKATVQAALCSFPLMLIKDVMHTDDKYYDQYILWGNQIVSTAILSILITAPLGLLFIQYLGPHWLTKDEVSINILKRTQSNQKREDASQNDITDHIAQLDVLLRKISLSTNQIDNSCILAEIRQVVWKCKLKVNIK